MIKWLLGHCIHQHTNFSKGVLIPSSNRSHDYLDDWRNRYETSSKIGFEAVNWPLVTSPRKHIFLQVSLLISQGRLLDNIKIRVNRGGNIRVNKVGL